MFIKVRTIIACLLKLGGICTKLGSLKDNKMHFKTHCFVYKQDKRVFFITCCYILLIFITLGILKLYKEHKLKYNSLAIGYNRGVYKGVFNEDIAYQNPLFVNNLNKNHCFINYSSYNDLCPPKFLGTVKLNV